MQTIKETGAASIFVELKDGNITIYHGEDQVRLQHFENVSGGSWGTMFDTIVELLREREN